MGGVWLLVYVGVRYAVLIFAVSDMVFDIRVVFGVWRLTCCICHLVVGVCSVVGVQCLAFGICVAFGVRCSMVDVLVLVFGAGCTLAVEYCIP